MANSNLPRPGRVLAIFLAVVVALYALLGLTALTTSSDTSVWKPGLGLDLQGGTRITLQAKSSSGSVDAAKLKEAASIIDQRVNGSGVSEAEVTTQGGNQIITEIPGKQKQSLVDTVKRTAQLRFRLVWGGQTAQPKKSPTPGSKSKDSGKSGQAGKSGKSGKSKDSGKTGKAGKSGKSGKSKDSGKTGKAGKSGKSEDSKSDPAASMAAARKAAGKLDWSKLSLKQMITAETSGAGTLPKSYQDAMAALQKATNDFTCNKDSLADIKDDPKTPLISCNPKNGEVLLLSPAVIEGTDLNSASAGIPSKSLQWVVNLSLGGQGKEAFDKVTGALFAQEQAGHSQQSRFAIVLDGEVLSAPTSNYHIIDGNSQITGNFTQKSAQSLANSLKYGALPLTFTVNGVTVEGPSLAGTQLDAGMVAGLVGLLLVVVYSLFYYRGLGLVVIASLVIAATITYAIVLLLGKSMNFTLTLPGIAGLIVAIGITADSFIVFFERLRDEVRDGKSLRLAVESGWQRAKHTILAADAVSFLAALVLYIFAIGVVRGFAFALGLTTLIDVFVVFFFTKPLLSLLARSKFFGQGHKLSGLDASHLGIKGRSVTQTARSPGTARPAGGTARTSKGEA